jgi:para-nitrobenzyl esterase
MLANAGRNLPVSVHREFPKMRILSALVAASCLFCAGPVAGQPVGQFPFALTREGQMLGDVAGEVAFFKGLAYAAAPVGPLRWRPPQPPPESSEMRTAYEFGAPCPQPQLPGAREDCLTLNVYRPFGVDGPLPVMVFIHGGGFVSGTANDALFDGTRLAQGGVIVVTVNYRLGALGWLAPPGASDGGSGNLGLMDQIAALQWVRDNIAAFGGDAGNVTLFGSGAGATSVALLMLSLPAQGLFHKAILQSIPARMRLRSAEQARDVGVQLLATLGTEPDPCAAAPSQLMAAELRLLAQDPSSFAPALDGRFITEDIVPGFTAGHQGRIPLLIGANDDETRPGAEHDIREAMLSAGLTADAQRKFYPDVAGPRELAARVYTDKMFSEPARLLARRHAATGAPVFRYRLAARPMRAQAVTAASCSSSSAPRACRARGRSRGPIARSQTGCAATGSISRDAAIPTVQTCRAGTRRTAIACC